MRATERAAPRRQSRRPPSRAADLTLPIAPPASLLPIAGASGPASRWQRAPLRAAARALSTCSLCARGARSLACTRGQRRAR
eukprot:6779094-Prymnesium_polylepis.1